ncbi:MAG: phosphoglycerate dehydrogenase [Selenomonadaceae bacterium]|nr:phosphoglycerate dehydrogenase [Selenomonadaceae bacterium]
MKVLIADGVSQEAVDILADFECVKKDKLSAEELLEIIPEFDALIVRSASKVTAEVIAAAKNLKIIGRAGVGVDNIDVPAATARGIIVINSPGGNTIAATEHTFAMMMAMSRNIAIANETLQKGEWNRKQYTGVELKGKTLGVIGMGRIGSGVAKRALAFDMKVIGYDPFINEERAKDMGVKVGTFDEVIETADFITVHMPKTPETEGMINKDVMARMKKGVRLVNCARGGIIVEEDLRDAVLSGQVASAAIDVFTSEPIPADHPLLGVPGITVTPHLGASTVEAQIGVALDVAKGIKAALNGEPVMTAVNMAPVSQQVMNVIAPYFDLAERMGCAVRSLADGAISKVEVSYKGKLTEVNTKMISTAVIKGMLSAVMEKTVNYVNAPAIAKERNITITETKEEDVNRYENLITVTATTAKGEVNITGTLFAEKARIISINNNRVDLAPTNYILIAPHINRPGVIGQVGSIMGAANVNINGMQVGSTTEDKSLMILSLDNEVPADVLKLVVNMDGIFDAKVINFNVL